MANFSHLNSRQGGLIALCVLFVALVLLSVGLRLWSRRIKAISWFPSDYMIALAAVWQFFVSGGIAIDKRLSQIFAVAHIVTIIIGEHFWNKAVCPDGFCY